MRPFALVGSILVLQRFRRGARENVVLAARFQLPLLPESEGKTFTVFGAGDATSKMSRITLVCRDAESNGAYTLCSYWFP